MLTISILDALPSDTVARICLASFSILAAERPLLGWLSEPAGELSLPASKPPPKIHGNRDAFQSNV